MPARDSEGDSNTDVRKDDLPLNRFIRAFTIALVTILLSQARSEHIVGASGGNNMVQTVALHRQDCTGTTVTPIVGTARLSLDDQGGGNVNPNGIEIRASVTAGVPRTSYGVYVVDAACQILVFGGTVTTDDSGRGDLGFHVLGSVVPPGTRMQVQLIAPAEATVPGPGPFTDVLTSDPASAP